MAFVDREQPLIESRSDFVDRRRRVIEPTTPDSAHFGLEDGLEPLEGRGLASQKSPSAVEPDCVSQKPPSTEERLWRSRVAFLHE